MNSTPKIGIDHLCVLGMPPVEFVHLAADLGCPWIATGFSPVVNNAMGFGDWSMLEDPALFRAMRTAMQERGVSISMGEGFWVTPDFEARNSAKAMDLWRELDVNRICTLSFDPDLNRSFEQFAQLAEMAAERDMDVVLEYVPSLAIANLPTALQALEQVNRDNFQLLIDILHLHRSGGNAADLAALPAGTIGYLQLCDAPIKPTIDDYAIEATFERLPPGAGELPLLEILRAVPADTFVGLEIPMLSRARHGETFEQLLGPCVEAARNLLQLRDCA